MSNQLTGAMLSTQSDLPICQHQEISLVLASLNAMLADWQFSSHVSARSLFNENIEAFGRSDSIKLL
jgi:hypothetical protein